MPASTGTDSRARVGSEGGGVEASVWRKLVAILAEMSADAAVYVVDDDPALRESLGYLLRSEGLTVRSFEGARQFLAEYDRDARGCIVVDVRMPEMNGLQLLQLQSNRITEMPNITRLNNSIHGQSTFVTDCGVPSAFDEPLKCENCTMCCK